MIYKVYENILRPFFQNELKAMSATAMAQGMLSLSNLAIGFLVAKYASKTEYGLYVILFSIVGIMGAYQSALINVPMMALVHNKQGDDKDRYVASLAAVNTFGFVIVLAVIGLAASSYFYLINIEFSYIKELLVLAIAIVIYVSREFMRTVNLVDLKMPAILKMDLVNLGTVVSGMLLLVYWDAVSALTGIIVLGSGCLAAYLYDKRHHKYGFEFTAQSMKKGLMENWHYGKWMKLGVTSSLVQDRSFMYIATAFLGLSVLAEISAAKLFLMPIGLLCLSSGKLLLAKGSKLLSNNKDKEFKSVFVIFTSIILVLCILYSLLLLAGSSRVLVVFGDKYGNIADLIALWSIYFLVYTLRLHLGVTLIAYKEFKRQGICDVYAGILTVLLCGVLVFSVGRWGAVLALILGELVTLALYANTYRSLKMEKTVPVAVIGVEMRQMP
jgi:O-antigen/teichoic acid export membrane protein